MLQGIAIIERRKKILFDMLENKKRQEEKYERGGRLELARK